MSVVTEQFALEASYLKQDEPEYIVYILWVL